MPFCEKSSMKILLISFNTTPGIIRLWIALSSDAERVYSTHNKYKHSVNCTRILHVTYIYHIDYTIPTQCVTPVRVIKACVYNDDNIHYIYKCFITFRCRTPCYFVQPNESTCSLGPCGAEFYFENMETYLRFLSFFNIEMIQMVVEILP